jgi:trimeric autotransporter adhesin
LPATGTVGTTLGTTSVTFNNIPAPVFYTAGTITSVIVPYGITGSTASVVLKTGSQTTAAFSIPVTASVPGVFTSNDSGSGLAVVFNQDGTVNSAANAAAAGSAIVLYATGEGATNPPGQDGLVASSLIFREPALPVSLTIAGQKAQVVYAGSAPGSVAGVMEVEAIVPTGAGTGAVPVVLTVGATASQANVTVNVK